LCFRLAILESDHYVLVAFNDLTEKFKAVGSPLVFRDLSLKELSLLQCVLFEIDHVFILESESGQGNAGLAQASSVPGRTLACAAVLKALGLDSTRRSLSPGWLTPEQAQTARDPGRAAPPQAQPAFGPTVQSETLNNP